jgi:hypothetical protein
MFLNSQPGVGADNGWPCGRTALRRVPNSHHLVHVPFKSIPPFQPLHIQMLDLHCLMKMLPVRWQSCCNPVRATSLCLCCDICKIWYILSQSQLTEICALQGKKDEKQKKQKLKREN